MDRMKFNNKFFATKEEAKEFQKEFGGVMYSYVPRSRTKHSFDVEWATAWNRRMEVVDPAVTPWCVAWNEHE